MRNRGTLKDAAGGVSGWLGRIWVVSCRYRSLVARFVNILMNAQLIAPSRKPNSTYAGISPSENRVLAPSATIHAATKDTRKDMILNNVVLLFYEGGSAAECLQVGGARTRFGSVVLPAAIGRG